MNTAVFNLSNLAVTEYTTPFTGVSGDFESTAEGVYRVGGALDDETRIPSAITMRMALSEAGRRLRAWYFYVHGTSLGSLTATVSTNAGASYSYRPEVRHGGVARFVLGRGIRDNYLRVSLSASGATPLNIDRVEFETTESQNRRM